MDFKEDKDSYFDWYSAPTPALLLIVQVNNFLFVRRRSLITQSCFLGNKLWRYRNYMKGLYSGFVPLANIDVGLPVVTAWVC